MRSSARFSCLRLPKVWRTTMLVDSGVSGSQLPFCGFWLITISKLPSGSISSFEESISERLAMPSTPRPALTPMLNHLTVPRVPVMR